MNNKTELGLDNKTILVTGAAGFIGYHLVKRLLRDHKDTVIIGLDNFSDYYDVSLKEWRCRDIEASEAVARGRWILERGSISDRDFVKEIFEKYHPSIVVNLAAQAGVRYSIENPDAYIDSNLIGFYNILEMCRHSYDTGATGVEHLVYASSSSVYGGSVKVPFSTEDNVDRPVSLYAATKKSNELLAHAYSKLYDIPATGLRFFTVYGPAGRPDMAYYSFTEKLRKGEKIKIFNYGNCKRDFTYVDDIVEGVIRVMKGAPARSPGDDGLPVPPYSVYNIGGGRPENLMDFVHILAEELEAAGVLPGDFNVDQSLELVPMQPGDVPVTYADSSALEKDYHFKPEIDLRTGLERFAKWYSDFILH